jgi:hypothetical protein
MSWNAIMKAAETDAPLLVGEERIYTLERKLHHIVNS